MMKLKNSYKFDFYGTDGGDTVVCVATVLRFDGRIHRAFDLAVGVGEYGNGNFWARQKFSLPKKKYLGKCVLKENDTNDIETAKFIARAKALRQANAEMANFLRGAEKKVMTGLELIQALEDDTRDRSEGYDIAIKERIGKKK
jgi:hypothetical protein